MNPSAQRSRVPPNQGDSRANKALERLEALPGMKNVKAQVEQMVQFAKVSKLREQYGLKTKPHTNHMVFTGNPGTGKTTAARLIGQAYAAMGLLKTSSDKLPFVEIHHTDVAHPHVGEGETRIKKKFAEAEGGILFIDEAYAFLGKSDHNTDAKIIAVIVQKMEDMRDNLMVIAAGYPDKMEQFLDFNPGLRSRFSNTVQFPDYSTADMVKIASFISDEMQYLISPEFAAKLQERLEREKKLPGFGNARTVRNIFEQSIKRQSVRVSKMSNPKKRDLITLSGEDISLEVRMPAVSEKESLIQSLLQIKDRLEEIEIEEMLS